MSEPTQLAALTDIRTSHCDELEGIVKSFENKMLAEAKKYKELEGMNSVLQEQWNQQMREIEEFHQKKVSEIKQYYKNKLDAKQQEIKSVQSQLKDAEKVKQQAVDEIEKDAEQEMTQVQYNFEIRIKEERDSLSGIREENTSMRVKFEKLSKDIDDRKAELTKMLSEERRLQMIIKSLGNDIQVLKRESQERDDTIMDKEKRIYDLKKKNQELEKFKFVLDYKILELRKQVEPRERDIFNLSDKINLMNGELMGYYNRNEKLDSDVSNLMSKLHATYKELRVEQSRKSEMRELMDKIRQDIQSVSELPQDSKDVKVSSPIV